MKRPFSRRSLLINGSLGLVVGTTGIAAYGADGYAKARKPSGAKPKNIIFCVADGMAASTLTMADYYQQIVNGKRSYWAELMDADYATTGLQATRSLNSPVTDSAAASSAWGSGRHIWNGQINMFPDGTALRPIASVMQEAGMRCGLVTTATITHATPAGFAISIVQRDLEGLIAEKYLASGVDILMGGGNRFFAPDLRPDKRDMYADFGKAGYKVARTRQELLAAPTQGKLLGVFDDSHVPYSVDRANDATTTEKVPTLAEMTTAALANLKNSPKGFLLQIEGGRVDHGGHANDLAALLYDQMAYEDAVKVAVDFALKDKDTLVIITTDHATGGPSLNGAGAEYIESTDGIKNLTAMKSSYGPVIKAFGDAPTADTVRQVVEAKLGIALTPEEAGAVAMAKSGKGPFATSQFYGSLLSTLAIVLGNHTKVTWTSLNHTADHVIVTAIGPGSEMVAGLTENIHFHALLCGLKGVKSENPPQMDFETARKHYEKLKVGLLSNDELFERYAANEDDGCNHHFVRHLVAGR